MMQVPLVWISVANMGKFSENIEKYMKNTINTMLNSYTMPGKFHRVYNMAIGSNILQFLTILNKYPSKIYTGWVPCRIRYAFQGASA